MPKHRTFAAVRRRHSDIVRFALASAWLGALALIAAELPAQAAPQAPKTRLELADSARGARAAAAQPAPATIGAVVAPAAAAARTAPRTAPKTAPTPAGGPDIAAGFRPDFVRNQTLIGVAIYAPAFATTVARDGLAWGASYLLVAGGSFVAAAEISREMTITDPMHRLATGAPIRGAIAASILASSLGSDPRGTAAAVLVGSVGGTAAALIMGRPMNDGEAAATLFGSDVLGLAGFAGATAAGLVENGRSTNARGAITVAGMLLGAPLGHAYAALAPYHVSPGDLSAMSASAGVGMLAGLTFIANGDRSDRAVAGALAIGGVAGLVVGDRLLVRRYDHTPSEGRMVMAGGLAGGLMGAGVALLTGGSNTRFSTMTAALTTVGAAGGIVLSQRYMLPKADGGLRLGALRFNPVGVVAAATGMRGAYTLGSMSF